MIGIGNLRARQERTITIGGFSITGTYPDAINIKTLEELAASTADRYFVVEDL